MAALLKKRRAGDVGVADDLAGNAGKWAARRAWVLAQADQGVRQHDIAQVLGISRARVCELLASERRRRTLEAERVWARAAVRNPRELAIRHLEMSEKTRSALANKFGDTVTLAELAEEPDLVASVHKFGPCCQAELTAIMAAHHVRPESDRIN